jgi:hypothetical protein
MVSIMGDIKRNEKMNWKRNVQTLQNCQDETSMRPPNRSQMIQFIPKISSDNLILHNPYPLTTQGSTEPMSRQSREKIGDKFNEFTLFPHMIHQKKLVYNPLNYRFPLINPSYWRYVHQLRVDGGTTNLYLKSLGIYGSFIPACSGHW